MFGILVPVFGVVLCGYLARRSGLLAAQSGDVLNRFIYYFALPPLLFGLTARVSPSSFFNWRFILAFLTGSACTAAIALAAASLAYDQRGPGRTLHALTAVFGNNAYLGVALFLTAFGPEGTLPAVVATVVSNTVFLGGAILSLELHAHGSGLAIRKVARAVLANPIVIPLAAGLAVAQAGIALPPVHAALLRMLEQPAAPVALFALGLSLAGGEASIARWEVIWLVFLKLVVHPAFTLLFALWLLPDDPVSIKGAVLQAAMPVGVLVAVVSDVYRVDPPRASASVILSTILSVFTLGLLLSL